MAASAPERASSRRLLVGFNPGSEAEPNGDLLKRNVEDENGSAPANEAAENDGPSVLNKLQKWADYEAMGQPVWPTRFIPMKTPMSTEILDNWSLAEAPRHALTVPLLLRRQAEAGRDVGLVIDLANHDCLYSDDMPECLEYEHVQLVAKVLPSREAINEVERIARSFWAEHPEKYIAIHCAYGFNRTGFVVCSYLCQACGLSVEQALENFAAARPPGVKHDKFVQELHRRYGGDTASSTTRLAPTSESSFSVATQSSPPGVGLAVGSAVLAPAPDQAMSSGQQFSQPPAVQQQSQVQQAVTQQQQHQSPSLHRPPSDQQEREENAHFEDAAALMHRGSWHRRSSSVRSAASGDGAPTGASPVSSDVRSPLPGSGASSRNHSRHGGSLGGERAGTGREAAAEGSTEDAAVPTAAGAGFTESARLLQRKQSRGGGLAQALAGQSGSSQRAAGSSPGSSVGGAAASIAGSSPPNGTLASSGDFSAAAAHLEGSNSMRRTTSLGLAKALAEDFLQNNGTPSADAPIAAAAAWEAERSGPILCRSPFQSGSAMLQPAGAMERSGSGLPSQLQQHEQNDGQPSHEQSRRAGEGLHGGVAGIPVPEQAAAAEAGARNVSSCLSTSPSQGSKLGTSPSRRGGIPLPPLRGTQPQPGCQAQPHQPHLQQCHNLGHLQSQLLQQQPGTPLTPASSGTPGSVHHRHNSSTAFPRSVSVDSDNPSLGFGMREALHHLRAGSTGNNNVRGPQALADLFREDSRAELATLDVEEHLTALAQAAGLDSPAATLQLPTVIEAAVAEALALEQANLSGGVSCLPPPHALSSGVEDGRFAATEGASAGLTAKLAAVQLSEERASQRVVAAAGAATPADVQSMQSGAAACPPSSAGSHGKCSIM